MSLSPVTSSSTPSQLLDLPTEMLGLVLSFVDLQGLQSCTKSSKYLSKVTIITSNVNKRNELKSFIDKVCSKLNNPIQIESLSEIASSMTLNFPNLLALKQGIFSERNKVVNVLMTLTQEELTALEKITAPSFCENIWDVAKICAKIPKASGISDESARENALKDISDALMALKEIDRALEIAINRIQDGEIRNLVLRDVCDALIEESKLDRAVEVANNIQDDGMRDLILRDVCDVLIEEGKLDKVVEVANNIQDDEILDRILRDVCDALIEESKIDEALEIATNRVQDNGILDRILRDVCNALIEEGKIDEALEIATNRIQDDEMRATILHDISDTLEEANDRTLEIANRVQNGEMRENPSLFLSKVLFM